MRKQYNIPTESDPIVAEKIREALDKPVEEKPPMKLPKPQPVDEIKGSGLKPVTTQSKKRKQEE